MQIFIYVNCKLWLTNIIFIISQLGDSFYSKLKNYPDNQDRFLYSFRLPIHDLFE